MTTNQAPARPAPAIAGANEQQKRLLTELRLAISFLTILPVIDRRPRIRRYRRRVVRMVPACRFRSRRRAHRRGLAARPRLRAGDSLGSHHRLAHRRHRRGSSRRTGGHGRRARRGTRSRARTRHSPRQPGRDVRRERNFLRLDAENPRALDPGGSPPTTPPCLWRRCSRGGRWSWSRRDCLICAPPASGSRCSATTKAWAHGCLRRDFHTRRAMLMMGRCATVARCQRGRNRNRVRDALVLPAMARRSDGRPDRRVRRDRRDASVTMLDAYFTLMTSHFSLIG